ncbi:hypothetical protein O9X99_23880 [Agrobacterium salinitolerans]|uniref:Uncharacterized protein n=1 Tax=Agrobacterium salinitolerans TaxID=1183413 RepID=A0ABY3BIW5_9HYPH|nr:MULTISPECIES: hypothetical protein [Agrobacterium]MCZ7894710.1 hypothetical protein [Agrobacterium salinitolerans]TRA83545.1 hypothetical protein EXN23_25095 [Agrobacterium salinitolerans]
MTYDFKSRVKRSIEMRAMASRNNAEIDAIIREFALQISDATDGHVIVEIAALYEIGGHVTREPGESAERLLTFEAIVANTAINEEERDDSDQILAELIRGTLGYPCTILCESYEFQCSDGKGLAEAMGQMIDLPATGEILYRLQNPQTDRPLGPSRRPL